MIVDGQVDPETPLDRGHEGDGRTVRQNPLDQVQVGEVVLDVEDRSRSTVTRIRPCLARGPCPGRLARHNLSPQGRGKSPLNAETGGFEPPRECYPPNRLAGGCFRPLSHVSAAESIEDPVPGRTGVGSSAACRMSSSWAGGSSVRRARTSWRAPARRSRSSSGRSWPQAPRAATTACGSRPPIHSCSRWRGRASGATSSSSTTARSPTGSTEFRSGCSRSPSTRTRWRWERAPTIRTARRPSRWRSSERRTSSASNPRSHPRSSAAGSSTTATGSPRRPSPSPSR